MGRSTDAVQAVQCFSHFFKAVFESFRPRTFGDSLLQFAFGKQDGQIRQDMFDQRGHQALEAFQAHAFQKAAFFQHGLGLPAASQQQFPVLFCKIKIDRHLVSHGVMSEYGGGIRQDRFVSGQKSRDIRVDFGKIDAEAESRPDDQNEK